MFTALKSSNRIHRNRGILGRILNPALQKTEVLFLELGNIGLRSADRDQPFGIKHILEKKYSAKRELMDQKMINPRGGLPWGSPLRGDHPQDKGVASQQINISKNINHKTINVINTASIPVEKMLNPPAEQSLLSKNTVTKFVTHKVNVFQQNVTRSSNHVITNKMSNIHHKNVSRNQSSEENKIFQQGSSPSKQYALTEFINKFQIIGADTLHPEKNKITGSSLEKAKHLTFRDQETRSPFNDCSAFKEYDSLISKFQKNEYRTREIQKLDQRLSSNPVTSHLTLSHLNKELNHRAIENNQKNLNFEHSSNALIINDNTLSENEFNHPPELKSRNKGMKKMVEIINQNNTMKQDIQISLSLPNVTNGSSFMEELQSIVSSLD